MPPREDPQTVGDYYGRMVDADLEYPGHPHAGLDADDGPAWHRILAWCVLIYGTLSVALLSALAAAGLL